MAESKISKIKSGMERYFIFVVAIFVAVSGILSCGKANFLGSGKALLAEKIEPPPPPPDKEFHQLFSLPPGDLVRLSSYTGTVDPVGTDITDDFDGDGIPNQNETMSNIWVADYPVIETSVAPPITMKIEVLEESNCKKDTFENEITTSDVERNIDRSAEDVHQEEVNEKTVQFQDSLKNSASYAHSSEMGISVAASVSVAGEANSNTGGGSPSSDCSGGVCASFSYSQRSRVANSVSASYGETTNKWKDVPFKNNLGRDATSLKRNEAGKKSQQFRREMREACTNDIKVKSDAGYIRAALYISNESVNMPVKISNIQCSFMLETPRGQLIPVQSFRLREEDYSLFQVEVYGGERFGPYIIELDGLNTAEIKEAISSGFNPRIFVIDYDMTHVEDSNYRQSLPNYTGDNLKIIEENAKGRTAGIKIVGPGFREYFRIAAFTVFDGAYTPIVERRTISEGEVVYMSPGVTLERALGRLNFSGINVEFADFVLDFSDIEPEMRIKKDITIEDDDPANYYSRPCFHFRGIKSLNGIPTVLPSKKIIDNPDGTKTYIMKPLVEWDEDDFANFRIWVVFDRGRYYRHDGDFNVNPLRNPLINDIVLSGDASEEYTYNDGVEDITVPKVQGLTGCVWPGDHYDIVYLDLGETMESLQKFGQNPLETEDALFFNTKWNLNDLGEYPFRPNAHAKYLGEAVVGDVLELKFKLYNSWFLNPDFGEPDPDSTAQTDIYSDFQYSLDMEKSKYPFNIWEALDFEISFGVDERYSDWMNIIPGRKAFEPSLSASYMLEDYYANFKYTEPSVDVLDYSWNYMDQEFTVKIGIPDDIEDNAILDMMGIGSDGVVKVFLRTSHNNAYRESIWPLKAGNVKRFMGKIVSVYYDVKADKTTLNLEWPTGSLTGAGNVRITPTDMEYALEGFSYDMANKTYKIYINGKIDESHQRGNWVYADLPQPLDEPEIRLAVDKGFFEEWNANWTTLWEDPNGWDGKWENIDNGKMRLLTPDGSADPYEPDFTPVHDLGYRSTNFLASNWIGNYNFGNPLWNSWSDASLLDDILNGMLNPYLTTTNYSMNILIKSISDIPNFQINTVGIDYLSESSIGFLGDDSPKMCFNDNKTLVVWNSRTIDGDDFTDYINARMLDTSNGQWQSPSQMQVSTVNEANMFQMGHKLKNNYNNAFVVWSTYSLTNDDFTVRGNRVDMSDNPTQNTEILINSVSHPMTLQAKTGSFYGPLCLSVPEIVASGDRALVLWHNFNSTFNEAANLATFQSSNVFGTFIDMTTGQCAGGACSGSEFIINPTSPIDVADYYYMPQAAISGDKAVVVWGAIHTDNFMTMRTDMPDLSILLLQDNAFIQARIIDMNTGSMGNFINISEFGRPILSLHKIAVWQNKGLILWGDIYGYLRGRFIDLDTGQCTGNEFPINRTSVGSVIPIFHIFGNKVIVFYDKYARIINMETEKFLGDEIVVPHPTHVSSATNFKISGNDKFACVIYKTYERYFFGRIIDLEKGSCLDGFIVFGEDNGSVRAYNVLVMGNSGLVSWYKRNDENIYTVRGSYFDTLPDNTSMVQHGTSNFFVSPLIERDYSVKVRIDDRIILPEDANE